MSELITNKTKEEKRLANNAYLRSYNARRRAESKQALKQVIKIKYDNEIKGGKEHE